MLCCGSFNFQQTTRSDVGSLLCYSSLCWRLRRCLRIVPCNKGYCATDSFVSTEARQSLPPGPEGMHTREYFSAAVSPHACDNKSQFVEFHPHMQALFPHKALPHADVRVSATNCTATNVFIGDVASHISEKCSFAAGNMWPHMYVSGLAVAVLCKSSSCSIFASLLLHYCVST